MDAVREGKSTRAAGCASRNMAACQGGASGGASWCFTFMGFDVLIDAEISFPWLWTRVGDAALPRQVAGLGGGLPDAVLPAIQRVPAAELTPAQGCEKELLTF